MKARGVRKTEGDILDKWMEKTEKNTKIEAGGKTANVT